MGVAVPVTTQGLLEEDAHALASLSADDLVTLLQYSCFDWSVFEVGCSRMSSTLEL